MAAGRLLKTSELPVNVRGELFRGIAPWVEPVSIPGLKTALHYDDLNQAATPVSLRRAAAEACLIHALSRWRPLHSSALTHERETSVSWKYDATLWPAEMMELEFDPDPQVRILFGRWLAVSGHPEAFSKLHRQYRDIDSEVRLASLLSLGMQGSQQARARLRALMKQENEGLRAAAIKGLAGWGVPELSRYAHEDSNVVRYAVAVSLAEFPSANAGLLLRDYFEKASPRVQLAALKSLHRWPDRLAIPLLLHAMGYGASKAAQEAFQRLQTRTRIDESFPLRKLQSERAVAMRVLARKYRLPMDFHELVRHEHRNSRSVVAEDRLQTLKSHLDVLANSPSASLRTLSLEQLKRITPDDVPRLEHLILQSRQSYPAVLFDEILAGKSEAHAALLELKHPDPLRQRRGAQKLAQLGMQRSLSRFVIQQMLSRIRERKDRVIWRDAMTAVMNDHTEESEAVALEASFHPVPSVRILACQYFRRHANPKYANVLLELMNDPQDRAVRLEAMKSAGYCQNPLVTIGRQSAGTNQQSQVNSRRMRGLRDFLQSSDAEIHRAAVMALARLGDDLGWQELIRMTYHSNPKVRLMSYQMMGAIGQSRFFDVLIERGWGERNPAARKAILKSLEEIVPEHQRPVGLSQTTRYDAKIRLWASSRNRAGSLPRMSGLRPISEPEISSRSIFRHQ
ncbi:MAG: hypothetical protein Tsb009_30190 [Planctomycetaceae bacterium]